MNADYPSDDFDPTRPWDDCGDEDPDSHSPRLRYYHQRLWSHRPLAGLGGERALVLEPRGSGLIDTGLGMSFFGFDEGLYLASDRAMASWWGWKETAALRQDPALMERILAANPVLDNMGGIIMWPGWKVGGQTLNQARGFGQKATIADRLDLTVECIRRAYLGDFDHGVNPLGPTLERYWGFFELFGGFNGYVEFWLLQDLLTEDAERVRFLMEGDLPDYDFTSGSPLPTSVDSYDEYLRNAQAFVLKRNARMSALWQELVGPGGH
jgi:hypothetical protein